MQNSSLWAGRELPGKVKGQWLEVDKSTPAYRRVEMAGFKIFDRIIYDTFQDIFRVDWLCFCGRQEGFDFGRREYPTEGNKIDVAKIIEDLGAISEDHLRKDGFTEEEIIHIRRAYDK